MGRRGGHGGHHGGAWKVAYADFVTAMMALFIVLWLLSQTDQSTRQKLSEYFRTGVFAGAPSVLGGGMGIQDKGFVDVQGEGTFDETRAIEGTAHEIKRLIAQAAGESPEFQELQKQIKVQVTEQGLLIQIVDGGQDLLFDVSSAKLKPQLIEFLRRLAPVLAKLPNPLQVHGHTDARPFPAGSGKSNWQLSFERADNARAALEGSGIRPRQVIGVYAHADSTPFDPDAFSPANRRLAILAVRRNAVTAATRGAPEAAPRDAKVATDRRQR